jgi:putative intracellular protease/amidase/YHS domain-containing protein
MKRRELLKKSVTFGVMAAVPFSPFGKNSADSTLADSLGRPDGGNPSTKFNPLKTPAEAKIPVAFPISGGAVLIDFAGPWEVFQSADIPGRGMMDNPFELYTVAETTNPIAISGGMKIVPDFTFQNAPPPKVIVIPAQSGSTDAMLHWIRKATEATDVTMSVCTGAFVLAATGLLSGKAATTHHTSYSDLQMQFPDVRVKRGARFVEEGNLATAGGLTSGMDLALRVIGRYFGAEAVERTAFQLEYQGKGWMDAESNSVFALKPKGDICAVCWMQVDRKTALASVYKGQTYYFCMKSHKAAFEATPEGFLNLDKKQ